MAKILAIDDSPDVLVVLRAVFKRAGHEIVTSSDPSEAMGLLEAHQPDAMILDVMMPRVSGWDVLSQARDRPEYSRLPIVMLTARGEVEDRVQGLRGGADDYQVKPFNNEELLARIEGLVARFQPEPEPELEPSLGMVIAEIERRLSDEEDLAGLFLGRFEVRALLGRGAMGTVLKGWDPKLERGLALKTLRLVEGERREHREQVSRLLREAVAKARVRHPNIVSVYDVGVDDSGGFMAMELVEGTTLETMLGEMGRIPYADLLPLAIGITRGLAAAHDSEVLHRDVKPGNVLLGGDGAIKVTDFGIAELSSEISSSQVVQGTPGYLAPEILDGETATAASDLFSLGVLLYECVTGIHPFQARNWRQMLHNTLVEDPSPLEEAVPELPADFSKLVERLMSKDPADRPSKTSTIADQFEELADHLV